MKITIHTSKDIPYGDMITMPDGRLCMNHDFTSVYIKHAERLMETELMRARGFEVVTIADREEG
jgi:hypothetical protein